MSPSPPFIVGINTLLPIDGYFETSSLAGYIADIVPVIRNQDTVRARVDRTIGDSSYISVNSSVIWGINLKDQLGNL